MDSISPQGGICSGTIHQGTIRKHKKYVVSMGYKHTSRATLQSSKHS